MSDRIVIASATRTPMGALQGGLASLTALQLGTAAIRATVEHAGLKPEQIEEVIMGCVLPAGQGQAPIRQAILGAGLPLLVGYTTVNRICGSGIHAAMNAYDAPSAGSVDVVVAGGMESMTSAPCLTPKGRGGYRIGHGTIYDRMILDGLEDACDKGRAMGIFGEDCAEKYGFTRGAQDHFATTSVRHAQEATESGALHWEITPVTVSSKAGGIVIDTDEGPHRIKVDKIPSLKPAFKKDGTVTATSSSSINDGAAVLVMIRESTAEQLGITPLAVMLNHTTHAQAPGWFTTTPVTAIDKLFEKLDWNSGDVDLFKINEAFAVVPMAVIHDLYVPHERVNVSDGACTLGHPIDTSGVHVIVTLLGALQHHGSKRGVASPCISGGETMAAGIKLY